MQYVKANIIYFIAEGLLYNYYGNKEKHDEEQLVNCDIVNAKEELTHLLVKSMYESSTEIEKNIISMRYRDNLKLTKISVQLNISHYEIILIIHEYLHRLFLYHKYKIDGNDVFNMEKIINLIDVLDMRIQGIENNKENEVEKYKTVLCNLRNKYKHILVFMQQHINKCEQNTYYRVISSRLFNPHMTYMELQKRCNCSTGTISIYSSRYRESIMSIL